MLAGLFLAASALHCAARGGTFPQRATLKTGPVVQHLAPDRVVISWETERPGPSVLEYLSPGRPARQVEQSSPTTDHRVTLSGLRPGQDYRFRIKLREPGVAERGTRSFSFDSSCDLRPVSAAEVRLPDGEDELGRAIAAAAERIVEESGVDRGYCLVLGCGEGRLALELARRTNLQVIGVEPDAAKVRRARRMLDTAGLYGVRIVIHHGTLEKLPYTDHFANLIVSGQTFTSGELPPSIDEVCRVLRPCGGVAWLGQPNGLAGPAGTLSPAELEAWIERSPLAGWKIERHGGLWATMRRGPLAGAGEWTHLYSEPGNSSCSNDRLQGPLQIQWFGRPGPRQMVDRHHRGMAPLVVGGRLIIAGSNRLKALDAYNGAPLWDLTVPNSRRVCVHRNSGHVVAAEDLVYLAAEGACRAIDAATGRCVKIHRVPKSAGEPRPDWGYLACVGDRLLGSGQRPGASYGDHSRHTAANYCHWDNVPMVVSDRLFCLDRHTGRELWTYRRATGSAIINPAIALGPSLAYFVESRSPAAAADEDGKVPLSVSLAKGSSYLVALDQTTGKVVWLRPVDLSAVRHALYLACARNTLLIMGTYNQDDHPRYELLAFDATNGQPKWSNHYIRTDKPAGGDHGEQDQHPVIIGGTIYSRPLAFDLQTGVRLPFELDRGGHGCGAICGSASHLFGRGSNPRMYPTDAGGSSSVALTTVTRPGCWINIIPAGGLLLIPEGSSGCSCAFSVQTSIALAPRRWE